MMPFTAANSGSNLNQAIMRDPDFQDELIGHSHSGTFRSRKTGLNIWQKMARVLEVIIYLLLILGFVKLLAPDLQRQKELERELVNFEKVKKGKEAEVVRFRNEHSHLTTDQRYLEAVARDRLNLQRDGEYVIHIER
jgi:cell division protein FtsB